jgi:ABC-type amino acid transport substrate-binding protein
MKLTSLALVLATTLVLAAFATGCATIMAPGPDRVPIASNPSGARVYVDDQLVGMTPVVVELDRERSSGRVRVETDGYHPALLLRHKTVNSWFWWNFCLGGWIGFVVDLATANFRSFDDTPVVINLIPAEGGLPPPGALPPAPLPPAPPPPGITPPSAAPQ